MAPEEHKIPIELQGQHEETSNQSAAPSQPTQDTHDASTREPGPDQQLEPADSGPAAWRMLFAAFMFEGLLWGFPLSFGVFQNYYTQLPEFKENRYITLVGTTSSGIPYLGGPIMTVIVRRYQNHRRSIIWVGWPLCILGLAAGSFANSLGALIMTQGIMYGVGFVIFYYPIMSMVNEWWVARRGMALGVMISAAGASGVAMPLIIEAMLHRYGHKTTLRAIAIAMAVLTGPLIPFMRPRLPLSQTSSYNRTDWSFLARPLFLTYCAANIAQGLGFPFPYLFLPSYATSTGLSARQGAMLLSLMSGAQVLGQWTFGILSDKMGLNLLVVCCTLMAALASFTSWGLAQGLGPLVVFAILYGFFAYGFCSMRARMGTAVSEEPMAALTTFGIFVFCQGVGNVLAGPISGGLLVGNVKKGAYGMMRYKSMVLFTGGCMLLSALGVGTWYLRPKRLRGR